MKRKNRIIAVLSVALAMCGAGALNTTHVLAAVQTKIALPSGYTADKVTVASTGDKKAISDLASISKQGMTNNKFYDTDNSDDREVDVIHMSEKDKDEMAKYTVKVINSARKQLNKPAWKYTPAAMHFAQRVAYLYYLHDTSIMSSDHDRPAIRTAAAMSGLNSNVGQVYEDESGLPILPQYNGHVRSLKALKSGLYFNVKQMLFGGFSGSDYNDLTRYNEYEHARDLLSLNQSPAYAKREFGISFSALKKDGRVISVHMMGVPKPYIQNYKLYK